MPNEATKQVSLSALASTVSSLVVLIPVLWFIGKPLIATALAEDIKDIVQQEATPIKSAFTVLLDRDINALRRQIAAMKFRQRTGEDWTADDAEYLAEMEIELEALQDAKAQLNKKDDT